MPDFTFTSPEGKSITVTAPEGATKEQAFQVAQQQMQSGAGGSGGGSASKAGSPNMQSPQMSEAQGAQPNPDGKLSGDKTVGGVAGAIGTSAAVGGILGAAAPEIITGAGVAAMAIPGLGEVVGPALIATGRVMRAARTGSAIVGALSGTTSEVAGQAAEAGGAGPAGAFTARLAGGMVAAPAAAVAGSVSKTGKLAWTALQKVLGGEEGGAAVATAKANIAKAVDTAPALDVHATLQEGVAHDMAAAEKTAQMHVAAETKRANDMARTDGIAASRVLDDAHDYADQLRAHARERAAVLDKATDGKLKTATAVRNAADDKLSAVGTPREPSDIGNELRAKVTGQQQEAMQARAQEYKQQVDARDNVVAQKESAGQTIDNEPGMKDFKQELSKKLLNTAGGRRAANGMAEATEPGVVSAYQKVYDSIINKRVQTGVDAQGAPQFQTFKTSFEAIDAVRRRLGETAFGGNAAQDATGYAALGKKAAADMYKKLANIQEQYAGPTQKVLQDSYAQSTGELAKFGASSGKKLTAVDRMDPEHFMKDPAAVAGQFFKSQQGVKDLRELTGDSELVNRTGSDFATRSIQGKSSAQVKQWAKANSDWTREIPGLQQKVNDYAGKLEQIERVGGKLEDRAKSLQSEKATLPASVAAKSDAEAIAARKRATDITENSVKNSQRIVGDAEKEAAATRDATVKKVQGVIKSDFPAESTHRLLTSGSAEEIATASRYLMQAPGGRAALEGSIRQSLRGMGEKELETQWSQRLKPALQSSGILSPQKFQKLEDDVQRVLKAYAGKQRLGLVNSLITSAIATPPAAAIGDGVDKQFRKAPGEGGNY